MKSINPNVFTSKKSFVHILVTDTRSNGGIEFWILNKQYYEIYYFNVVQITDFDIQVDLINALENELILRTTFVLHMKDKIIEFLNEIPGTIYLNKLECYRDLYLSLTEKLSKTKSLKIKNEIEEKIDYIESTFPELII